MLRQFSGRPRLRAQADTQSSEHGIVATSKHNHPIKRGCSCKRERMVPGSPRMRCSSTANLRATATMARFRELLTSPRGRDADPTVAGLSLFHAVQEHDWHTRPEAIGGRCFQP